MKRVSKVLSLLLAVLMMTTMMTSAVAESEAPDLSKHLEITWAGHADTTPPAEEGTWFQKYLEEKWNVKITPLNISFSEIEAWDLYFASGNTADYISQPGPRYNTLIDQALVRPISLEMLYKYAPNWMAKTIEMVGSKEAVEQMLTYADGNVYCMPYIAYTAAFPFSAYIRTDWLEKVGLDVPKTLDEYHDVISAFVHNDPDGDGENNTLGISGANGNFHYVFGAYGIMMNSYYLQDDGTVIYTSVDPAYKEALKTLAAWYAEGLIDPETFTDNRANLREKWASGRIGIMNDNAWWGEAARGNNSVFNMLYNNDPDAKVTIFPAVTGPTGLSGASYYYPNITGQGCVLFGADTTDEEVIRIMQMKESFTYIDEYIKGRYGEEGVQYTINEEGTLVMSPEWDFVMQRSYGVGQFYALQPQSIADASVVLTPQDIATNELALQSNKVYSGRNFYAPRPNEAENTYGADVATIVNEYYANAIMGKVDVDATWDDYVSRVNAAGLTDIIKEYEEMLK
jgi:putative aldouronate transport system substrate-binding protein